MEDVPRYDLDQQTTAVRKPSRRKSSSGGAARAWAVEVLPKWLAFLVVAWIAILFHTVFTEAAEYEAEVAGSTGEATRMLIPGAQAPDPQDAWTGTWDGRTIRAGDQLRAGPGSTLDVLFYEQSLVRLNPGAAVGVRELHFDRGTGSRRRMLVLQSGALAVRTGPGIGDSSQFQIRTSQGTADGFDAFYLASADAIAVSRGPVVVRTPGGEATITDGQAYDFRIGKTRAVSSSEQQQLAGLAAKLPAPDTSAKVRTTLVNLEEGIVLANSVWLLKLCGHESGEGNPFVGLSVVNSSRRAQAKKRLADLRDGITGTNPVPTSIRLDDFAKMGVSSDRVNLMRNAYYRGQLMSYQGSGDQFRATALATDRQHTKLVMNQSGVSEAGG